MTFLSVSFSLTARFFLNDDVIFVFWISKPLFYLIMFEELIYWRPCVVENNTFPGGTFSRSDSVTFHHKSLQLLAVELYKRKNNLSDQLKKVFLHDQKKIPSRHESYFKSRSIRTVFSGAESLSYLGPKIWDIVPSTLKEIATLKEFKEKIKHWKPSLCPCRNCRIYIDGVGFIWKPKYL